MTDRRFASPDFSRRALFAAGGAAVLGAAAARAETPAPAAAPAPGFGFADVVEIARTLADKPHAVQQMKLTGIFADMGYDRYRSVRPRPEARLWRSEKLGFEAELLPPGGIFRDPVQIFELRDGVPTAMPFDAGMLEFGAPAFDLPEGRVPAGEGAGLQWSGFRLRCPINRPDVLDEVAVFQGASYFRAIGRGQVYGTSARALAIRTGAPEGEEFPVFSRFWLVRPDPDANEMRFHALLESPSLTGAYDFTLRPGADTTIDVRSVLFPRVDLGDVGMAPLTSMYFFGSKERAQVDDYRDAVHDAGGLQILNGHDERIWRPLANPATLQFSTFLDENPKGFGLVQRRRAFEEYQDAEARYDLRPSAWITPAEDWGAGGCTLVEIPTGSEFNDNIVAFWRPGAPLKAKTPQRVAYRLHWCVEPPDGSPALRVMATRSGLDVNNVKRRVLMIDFDLQGRGVEALELRVETGAEMFHAGLSALPTLSRARAALVFTPPSTGTAEFRLWLAERDGGATVSEIWLHRWTPR